MAIRTYTVGDQSGVKRLDNLTGSWQDVSLNVLTYDIILYDVMTDPLNADKVFICGERDIVYDNPGIFWSSDAGTTWNKCIGDITDPNNIGSVIKELWVVDSNIIYATSDDGYVFKSVDGGITFNNTIGKPGDLNPAWISSVKPKESPSLHFINADVGVVIMGISNDDYLCKTIDGGVTWTFTNLTSLGVTGSKGGVHMNAAQTVITIVASSGVYVSVDSGVSYTQKNNFRLLHLTWVDDNTLWAYGISNSRVISTDGSLTWNVLNPANGSTVDRAGHHYTQTMPYEGFFAESSDIFSTTNGSLTGTLSEANQFGGGIQAVWTGTVEGPSLRPGCTDPLADNFDPLANADCNGDVEGTDYSCCAYSPSVPSDECPCPEGSTVDPITGECIITTIAQADCKTGTYEIGPGAINATYGSNGGKFNPNISGYTLPLADMAGTDPNYLDFELRDNDGTGTQLPAIISSAVLWKDRMEAVGLWTTEQLVSDMLPLNEWIGFSACIEVPVTGVYSIGFAADNYGRVSLDGTLLIQLDAGGIYSYTHWTVVEITLTAGTHIIALEGLNTSGAASFGAEIYKASSADLAAMTTLAQLDPVIIWSTSQFISGNSEPSYFDLGENSGCSCPDGFILNTCGEEPTCTKIEVVAREQCNCYRAINCEDETDTELITIDVNLPPLDLTVIYTFFEFPDKCWRVELSEDCGYLPGDPGVPAVPGTSAVLALNTGFIDGSDTLGTYGNDDFNWKCIETPDGPITAQPAIIVPLAGTNMVWGTLPLAPAPFEARWICHEYPHSPTAPGNYVFEREFNVAAGTLNSVEITILTDNTARCFLNGNFIGDNIANGVNAYSVPNTFFTDDPTHFITGGPQVLRIELLDWNNNESTVTTYGFDLLGELISLTPGTDAIPPTDGLPVPSTEVSTNQIFPDCEECLGYCYRLIDCQGIKPAFYTDSNLSGNLSEYVGQVVNIVPCPETCWVLEEVPCDIFEVVAIEIIKSYPDCIECLPKEPAPEPFIKTNRTVKPGYNTKGCSPEYVHKISCGWSENLYQRAASRRYGIEFCCGSDFDDLDIKKQLMDFKALTDPEACIPELICPEPDPIIPIPPVVVCVEINFANPTNPVSQNVSYENCSGGIVNTSLARGQQLTACIIEGTDVVDASIVVTPTGNPCS